MVNGKKVLGLIPARYGSKRLPRKNILDLNGKPLIAWTIEEAKKSQFIDEIVVSTDSDKIATVSKKFGASVPFLRPRNLSSDKSTSIDAVIHALRFLSSRGDDFYYVVLLQPTSPLRLAEDIDSAFSILNKDTKAVVSVCEAEHSPLWTNTLPDNHSMERFLKREIVNKRSQDLPKFYRLNGAIYISEVNFLIQEKSFFSKSTKAYIMPIERSVDIDNEIDWLLANVMLNRKMQ